MFRADSAPETLWSEPRLNMSEGATSVCRFGTEYLDCVKISAGYVSGEGCASNGRELRFPAC